MFPGVFDESAGAHLLTVLSLRTQQTLTKMNTYLYPTIPAEYSLEFDTSKCKV